MIWWAGKSSDDVRVKVEYTPNYNLPERQSELINVPGRNGAIAFDYGAYNNISQTYDIYISAEKIKLPRAAHDVAQWLQGPKGYQRLQDDYDLTGYKMAVFTGPIGIENILNRFGRCTIEFNCKPQKFLIDGERPVIFNDSSTLENYTFEKAAPLIKVYGSGSGNLQIGEYACAISNIDEYIMLDSDVQNAYKGTTNLNANINIDEFPLLVPGSNEISWTGGITSVEITPRWWTT